MAAARRQRHRAAAAPPLQRPAHQAPPGPPQASAACAARWPALRAREARARSLPCNPIHLHFPLKPLLGGWGVTGTAVVALLTQPAAAPHLTAPPSHQPQAPTNQPTNLVEGPQLLDGGGQLRVRRLPCHQRVVLPAGEELAHLRAGGRAVRQAGRPWGGHTRLSLVGST